MRCSGRFAHLQSSSFIEMSLKLISGVLVDIEIIWVRDWEAVGDGCWKELYGGRKLVEKQGFGTTGVNCKQLFASIMWRLHFNMAFPGIHVILAWGCALSGDLCLRTEHLLFVGQVFLLPSCFILLKLKAQGVTWAQQIQWSVWTGFVLWGFWSLFTKKTFFNKENVKFRVLCWFRLFGVSFCFGGFFGVLWVFLSVCLFVFHWLFF